MSNDLPPFNENAVCAKCGHKVAGAFYCEGGEYRCVLNGRRYAQGEHHHRWCERCKFGWMEAVLSPAPCGTGGGE